MFCNKNECSNYYIPSLYRESMNKIVASIISLILLIQIASYSLDEAQPTIERTESFQGDDDWKVSGRNNSTSSAPVISNMSISPSNPVVGDTLYCSWDYYDQDGDPDQTTYWWYENGTSLAANWSNSPLDTSSLQVGSQIYCEGDAYDGFNWGNTINSQTVTLGSPSNSTGNNNNTGGNNTSCGTDPTLTDLWASTDSSTWGTWTNTVYGYYNVNCTIAGKSYTLEATLIESGGWSSYSFWNWTETNDYEYMSESWTNLSAGSYCVNATLWEVSSGVSNFVDSDYPCFTLATNNTGGNNTGGNNTGGNNTGGNNTLGCGENSSMTDLTVTIDSSIWDGAALDTVYSHYEVDCSVTGYDYRLDVTIVEITSGSYSNYHFWNWTETDTSEQFSYSWSNLSAGTYCVNATLWGASPNAYLVDMEYPCFTLSTENTGGNSTGGNNTGGNNTGGNNTGGNNTGGNNTLNDCTNSTQSIDGWLTFIGIDPVYEINSPFGGEMNTCWAPGQTSMSLMAWLNSSTGAVIDIQAYSGSNFWTSSSGAQPLSAMDGHWMFPIHQGGSIYGLDYAPLNIPVGDYCFEGLLKVYDGNSFVPVDHQTACFTVVDLSTGPCVGGSDAYPSGLEWITVNPVPTMSTGIVGNGDPVANHFEIGGLSNYGDCNATYKFAFNLVRLSGGTGGSGIDYAYPSDTSMSATGICVGTTSCQFDIVKYPTEGCYTVHASLYSYPANQLLVNDQWEWWQVGNVSCVTTTNTPPEVSSVVINPSSPLETDILVCSYVFSDADNDPDNSLFTWTINGVTAPSTSAILDNGYSAGDFVTCAVLAHDGIDNGNIGTSTVLIATNSTGGSSGSVPSIGIVGTLAAIGIGFVAITRRESEDENSL